MDIMRKITAQNNPAGSVFDARSMLRENLKYVSVRDRPERLCKISPWNAANNSEGPNVRIKTKFAVQPVRKAPIVPSWVLLVPRKVDVWAHVAPRREQESHQASPDACIGLDCYGVHMGIDCALYDDFHRF